MSTEKSNITFSKPYEAILFRGLLFFAIITSIPFYPSFYLKDYSESFQTKTHPFRIIDVVSQNNPWFFDNASGKNYVGWLTTLFLSILVGGVWHLLDKKRKDYSKLTYWFFVVVRYGLALRMSWFAIAKVFPVQMPFPTISQLNTNLGEFTPGKLYWLTTGVSPFFEVFAGVFELVATVLILFRRTTTLGALMMIAILLPIWFVNIGYDAGVEVTSLHILTLAILLLVKDIKAFWEILILHKTSIVPNFQAPHFTQPWQNTTRLVLKWGFILVFLVYRGFEYGRVYAAEKTFKLPLTDGVKSLAGFYDVANFQINHKTLPYNPNDTLRWQNVVFEKFNTFSIKVANQTRLNTDNKVRTTEYYGNVGRLYYGYDLDSIAHKIVLKNRADISKKLIFHYQKTNHNELILNGINESGDSLSITLKRQEKYYPLVEKQFHLFGKK
ncbi:hypothetical protein [Flectobacillus rivi]|uniref:DoxX family protein n=1 Tax=Flectobacillus rivi TaxID=2984209 RepID=A0ABT6Z921_9BACT|nr:hypothetical protein [Flectobacillus rivi]MDI9877625.1 hypothetical protein [Flectobacillus rivi]